MYYMIAPTNSDLYHHGILGQKWGKQNGPPYPLSGSDHSAAEKKAGWKKSLSSNARKAADIAGRSAKKAITVASSGARKTAKIGAKVAKDTLKTAGGAAKFAGKAALIGTLAGGGPVVGAARLAAYGAIKKKIKANAAKRGVTTADERHKMSDDELNYRVGRVRQENELRRLEAENVDAGRAMIRDIGKTAVKTAATGAALYAGKAIVTKQFSAMEFGDAMFRGGAKKK